VYVKQNGWLKDADAEVELDRYCKETQHNLIEQLGDMDMEADIELYCKATELVYKDLDNFKYEKDLFEHIFENLMILNKTTLSGINPEEYSTHNSMIYDSIILGVSTYSCLALSVMSYFKWDDKREKANEYKGKFLELHNRINYQLDILRPWKHDNNFDNQDETYYENAWENLMINLEKEYLNIIDIKKYLFIDSEKLLTETERIRFLKRLYYEQTYRNTHEQKIKELSLEHKRRKKNIEQENIQLSNIDDIDDIDDIDILP
jgi:hypothetical protein